MRHLKRMIAFIAMLAMSLSCMGPVYAANGSNEPQASPTLSMYAVRLDPGDNKGELDISFDVTATDWADSLGVSYIEIYAAGSKTPVKINQATASELGSSGFSYTHTYTYTKATSGVYYYAIVAVYAEIDGIFHSRTLTTSTVKAP